jgi:hypothetical protein
MALSACRVVPHGRFLAVADATAAAVCDFSSCAGPVGSFGLCIPEAHTLSGRVKRPGTRAAAFRGCEEKTPPAACGGFGGGTPPAPAPPPGERAGVRGKAPLSQIATCGWAGAALSDLLANDD